MRRLSAVLCFAMTLLALPSPAEPSVAQDSAQAQEPALVNVDSAAVRQVVEKVDQAVAVATDGAKTGAEFVWPILVRQQVIEGFVRTLVLLMGLTFVFWSFWAFENDYGPTDRDGDSVPAIVAVAAGAILTFAGFMVFFGGEAVSHIFNPQFHAIHDAAEMLGITGR